MDSGNYFAEAQKYIPGGVNSPVRAFLSVDMEPLYIKKGREAYLYDIQGNKYLDYVCSWGPLILGHLHSSVVTALQQQLQEGTSFGAPTQQETELAQLIVEAVPSVEMVRMVNSGTEAAMSAIRLARGHTGRAKILKFAGCYHGHSDSLLIKAGSGVSTLGLPDSPGVTAGTAADTITAPYNNLDAVKEVFNSLGEEIAAVIVEPVAGNMGVIPPVKDFLEGLREITKEYGSVLIFDEVMTGFRVAYGGAQSLYNVIPDLTCLGKIIGGGLPVGAYGGRQEIMNKIAPAGPVYQAGTLSGNPLAMAAGVSTLKELKRPEVYKKLEDAGSRLEKGIKKAAINVGLPITINRVGSMITVFFNDGSPITGFEDAKNCDKKMFNAYFGKMLRKGIYFAPSQFEAAFISTVHTLEDINKTIAAAEQVFKEIS